MGASEFIIEELMYPIRKDYTDGNLVSHRGGPDPSNDDLAPEDDYTAERWANAQAYLKSAMKPKSMWTC
jgi:hypothetical protein